jgi:hypothetical protein
MPLIEMIGQKWPTSHNGHVKINLSKMMGGFLQLFKSGIFYSNFFSKKLCFLLILINISNFELKHVL